MIQKDQIEKLGKKFAEEYGELTLLKANLAVINQILIDEGKEQELYSNVIKAMYNFRKKVSGD